RDPPLRRALAGTHAGLGRLLRQRTVRVDVDPHLSASLDVTGHRDTSGLDLAVRHVCRSQCLDAPVTERDGVAALRHAAAPGMVLLAVLDTARDEHASALRSGLGRGSGLGSVVSLPLGVGTATATASAALASACTAGSRTAGATTRRLRGLLRRELLVGEVALVDPHLHADPAEGGVRLEEAVVDVRAERVQRHTALAVELGPAHLSAAQAAAALHADALGARTLCALDRLAHRA